MKILKEPLLHFLLIGAAFFGLYAYLNPESMGSEHRIVVDEGRVDSIVAGFKKTWNREPSAEELQRLVDDFVLEEIYYRQALDLGIDKNDSMIRRRLRQKMEFLSTSIAASIQPSEVQLEEYLQTNAEKYRNANRYTFEQIYINPDRSDLELDQRITEVHDALQAQQVITGDPTLLPPLFDSATGFQVNNALGKKFSDSLDSLPLNEWSEPLRSGLGIHFVKITAREMGAIPVLDAVRDQVVRDWSYEKNVEVKAQVNKAMLADYKVVVEWPQESDS